MVNFLRYNNITVVTLKSRIFVLEIQDEICMVEKILSLDFISE